MRGSRALRLTSLTALALGSLSVTCAHAQSASRTDAAAGLTDEDALTEIVVTAEKRSQSLTEVPVSITAITQEDIRTRRIDTVADIVRQTPNVSFGEIGFGTQLSSRGIGTSLITGIGESSVAVYLDGINIPRPAMASMIQRDLGRVEFLRGPQGTLYGRNATGGVLNLVSPEAPTTLHGGGRFGVGNYSLVETAADVGGPLGETVEARLFTSYTRRGGYTKNLLGTGRLDALRAYGFNGVLRGDFDGLRITARANYQAEHSSGPTFQPIQTGIPVPAGSYSLVPHEASPNVLPNRDRHAFVGSLRVEYDVGTLGALGDATLTSLSGFVAFDPDVNAIDADGTSVNFFSNRVDERDRSFSQELNLVHTGGRADWTIGAYYIQERNRADRFTDVPGFAALGLSRIQFLTRNRTSSKSVFADTTVHTDSNFHLFGGVRYTWDRQRQLLTSQQIRTNGTSINRCTPADPLGNLLRKDEALTGRLGARYEAGDANLYVQASRGYKSGGIGYSTCGNTFQPERMNAIEVGVKTLTANDRLRVNASAFYYDLKNLQVEQIVTVGSIISSVPKTRIYGAELEGDWVIVPRLRVNLAIGLLNAKYVRFFDTDSLNPAAGLQDLSGNRLNRAPTFSGSYGVQYEQPLASGSLTFRVEGRSTSKFTLRPAAAPLDIQDGYSLFDGSVTWANDSGDFKIRAWAKNLSKRDYIQGLFSTAVVQRVATYGAPRTAGVEVALRF